MIASIANRYASSTSPPSRNAPASSMLTKPWAKAVRSRAASSERSRPTTRSVSSRSPAGGGGVGFGRRVRLRQEVREEELIGAGRPMGEGPVAIRQDPHGLGRILDVEGRGDDRTKLRCDVVRDRPDQRRPAGEALVERRSADAHRVGDRLHGHGVEPSSFEEGSSGADDRVGRGPGAGGAHPATVCAFGSRPRSRRV